MGAQPATAAVDDGGIAGIAVAALFVLIFGAGLAIYWTARRRHVPMKTVLADLTLSTALGKRVTTGFELTDDAATHTSN